MNRKPFVVALVALLALAIGLPASPAAAEEPDSTVYLALGDSLAWGEGATDRFETAYVPHFYRFLQGDKHSRARELVNLAVGGETSASFITGWLPPGPQRTPQLTQALAVIADPNTDVSVVTLDIGGNDLLRLLAPGEACSTYPPTGECLLAAQAAITQFYGNYGYILTALTQALAADPGEETLMVMAYYNPWSGTGSAYEGVVAMLMLGTEPGTDCAAPVTTFGMNDIITCVGTAFGATVVDVYPTFEGKGLELTHIAEGDIHANDSGYAQIASDFRAAYLNR
jgi:lysophospholipase L1-like esterase